MVVVACSVTGTNSRATCLDAASAWMNSSHVSPATSVSGKKRGKARVETDPLDVSEGDGEFDLGHPIGAYDTSLTPIGNLVTKRMRPTPLVMQASYEGAYVELKSSDPDDDGIQLLLTQRSSRPNDEDDTLGRRTTTA